MLQISEKLIIPDKEIELNFIRSSGSGGQNVNKVATGVHLRFDVINSSLPAYIKPRLLKLNDHHITKEGIIIIKACVFRTQDKNREDALERLKSIIQKVLVTRKKRIPTKPTKNSQRKRVDNKNHRGQQKLLRGKVKDES